MSDHLIDEIANEMNNRGKKTGPPAYDAGGLWVFLIALAIALLCRFG